MATGQHSAEGPRSEPRGVHAIRQCPCAARSRPARAAENVVVRHRVTRPNDVPIVRTFHAGRFDAWDTDQKMEGRPPHSRPSTGARSCFVPGAASTCRERVRHVIPAPRRPQSLEWGSQDYKSRGILIQ